MVGSRCRRSFFQVADLLMVDKSMAGYNSCMFAHGQMRGDSSKGVFVCTSKIYWKLKCSMSKMCCISFYWIVAATNMNRESSRSVAQSFHLCHQMPGIQSPLTSLQEVMILYKDGPYLRQLIPEIAKAIYSNLFDWLVEPINKSSEAGKKQTGRSISILDNYGKLVLSSYALTMQTKGCNNTLIAPVQCSSLSKRSTSLKTLIGQEWILKTIRRRVKRWTSEPLEWHSKAELE